MPHICPPLADVGLFRRGRRHLCLRSRRFLERVGFSPCGTSSKIKVRGRPILSPAVGEGGGDVPLRRVPHICLPLADVGLFRCVIASAASSAANPAAQYPSGPAARNLLSSRPSHPGALSREKRGIYPCMSHLAALGMRWSLLHEGANQLFSCDRNQKRQSSPITRGARGRISMGVRRPVAGSVAMVSTLLRPSRLVSVP